MIHQVLHTPEVQSRSNMKKCSKISNYDKNIAFCKLLDPIICINTLNGQKYVDTWPFFPYSACLWNIPFQIYSSFCLLFTLHSSGKASDWILEHFQFFHLTHHVFIELDFCTAGLYPCLAKVYLWLQWSDIYKLHLYINHLNLNSICLVLPSKIPLLSSETKHCVFILSEMKQSKDTSHSVHLKLYAS